MSAETKPTKPKAKRANTTKQARKTVVNDQQLSLGITPTEPAPSAVAKKPRKPRTNKPKTTTTKTAKKKIIDENLNPIEDFALTPSEKPKPKRTRKASAKRTPEKAEKAEKSEKTTKKKTESITASTSSAQPVAQVVKQKVPATKVEKTEKKEERLSVPPRQVDSEKVTIPRVPPRTKPAPHVWEAEAEVISVERFSIPHVFPQIKQHYDYDGLRGAWLWLPWWFHLSLAAISWPICFWLLPHIATRYRWMVVWIMPYVTSIGWGLMIFCLISAAASGWKAYQLSKQKPPRRGASRRSI